MNHLVNRLPVRWLWRNLNTFTVHKATFSASLFRRKLHPVRVDKQLLQSTTLDGTVDKIVHYNESTGAIIMKIKPLNLSHDIGRPTNITVVAYCPTSPMITEQISCTGQWKRHKTFGDQFNARNVVFVPRDQQTHNEQLNTDELITYLSSNMAEVGPARAARIVSYFGTETINILNNEIHRLREVPGLTERVRQRVTADWNKQHELREQYIMLHKHNIRGWLAQTLVKEYGTALTHMLKTDAYSLTRIRGIGFVTADRIAQSFGFAVDSRERVKAALWHVLNESIAAHVYLPQYTLLKGAATILKCDKFKPTTQHILPALKQLVNENAITETVLTITTPQQTNKPSTINVPNPFEPTILHSEDDTIEWNDIVGDPAEASTTTLETNDAVLDDLNDVIDESQPEPVYYLPWLYKMELGLADMLTQLLKHTAQLTSNEHAQISQFVTQSAAKSKVQLSDEQQQAVEMATIGSLSVLTGGPGCGKTLTVATIVNCWKQMGYKCLLTAPTGRAASRLSELTNHPAATIHRALKCQGFNDTTGNVFTYNESKQLPYDAVVVDEMSMVDLPLMYALVSAIKPGTKLLLVGDADQLPPLTAGDVLRDVIESRLVPTTVLSKPFRQAIRSQIISNAHKIKEGNLPVLESVSPYKYTTPQSDCLFIDIESVSSWAYRPVTRLPIPVQPTTNQPYNAESTAVTTQRAVAWITEKLLPSMKFKPYNDLQVLTPMKVGSTGTKELNRTLSVLLNDNHSADIKPVYQSKINGTDAESDNALEFNTFKVNDRVLQIKNDYRKSRIDLDTRIIVPCEDNTTDELHHVFNGEIGVVTDIQLNDDYKSIVVKFDEPLRYIVYSKSEQQTLLPAWAMTVHKSQGGEFPVVALVLTNHNYVMLHRQLLYTAITRAKELCIVIGHMDAIHRAVDVVQSASETGRRYSWLHQRLIDQCAKYTVVRQIAQ